MTLSIPAKIQHSTLQYSASNIVMLGGVLHIVMLRVIMQSVILLNAVLLSVVTPRASFLRGLRQIL
jgi:hypothetical protein